VRHSIIGYVKMDGEFVHSFRSKDGKLLKIRPLRPQDSHHLVDLFDNMGPESRYLRFNLALNDPDRKLVWSEARRLSTVDPERDGAWLVFGDMPGQPEAPLGVVRYMRRDDETAEAAVVVRDDMQNQGIGSELLAWLVKQARLAGITRLVATIQRGNRVIWHLVHKFELPIDFKSEGSHTYITVDLTELEPTE
jgi:acetyltransferase